MAYEDQVAAGIAFLDQSPSAPDDWREKITEPLRMSNTGLCVLGQVFGGYWDAREVAVAEWQGRTDAELDAECERLGFLLPEDDEHLYVELADEWNRRLGR